MLQSLKSSLLRTGYLTRQQLAEAEEYREAASCSLPRALWSLRVMHPGKFVNLCRQILDRPRLRDWLLKHSLDPELPWLIEPIDLVPVRFLPCGWLNPQTVVVATEEPGYPGVWQAVKRLCPGVEKIWEIPATEKQILTVILERKLAADLLGSRLTLEQWQQALDIRRRTGSSLGQVLTRLSYLSTPEYLSILAHLLGYPTVSRLMGTGLLHREENLSQQFDPELMMRHLFYPLAWADENALMVMVNDPLDWEVDEILYAWRPGLRIEKVLGTEQDITQLLSQDQGPKLSQEAVYKLMARLPEESASRVFTPSQIAVGYGLLLLFLLGLATAPWTTLTILVLLINLFYVASILFKLLLSLVGSADRFHQITDEEVAALDDRTLPIYTILVPVYKEPEVMPILIKSLSKLDYPHERLDVLILLEENDRATIEAARAAKPPATCACCWYRIASPRPNPKPATTAWPLPVANISPSTTLKIFLTQINSKKRSSPSRKGIPAWFASRLPSTTSTATRTSSPACSPWSIPIGLIIFCRVWKLSECRSPWVAPATTFALTACGSCRDGIRSTSLKTPTWASAPASTAIPWA
jgi:hypothetical protein